MWDTCKQEVLPSSNFTNGMPVNTIATLTPTNNNYEEGIIEIIILYSCGGMKYDESSMYSELQRLSIYLQKYPRICECTYVRMYFTLFLSLFIE